MENEAVINVKKKGEQRQRCSEGEYYSQQRGQKAFCSECVIHSLETNFSYAF